MGRRAIGRHCGRAPAWEISELGESDPTYYSWAGPDAPRLSVPWHATSDGIPFEADQSPHCRQTIDGARCASRAESGLVLVSFYGCRDGAEGEGQDDECEADNDPTDNHPTHDDDHDRATRVDAHVNGQWRYCHRHTGGDRS